MILYHFLRGRDGKRKRGEFPIGTLDWDGQKPVINCRDKTVRAKLEKLFFNPLILRLPAGEYETALGHYWAELDSGDEDHFLECLRRIPKLDLIVDYDS